MTDDKITALVARLRRTSGFLEEYEFEGAASEAAGLMNEASDALEASVQSPAVDEWRKAFYAGERHMMEHQAFASSERIEAARAQQVREG